MPNYDPSFDDDWDYDEDDWDWYFCYAAGYFYDAWEDDTYWCSECMCYHYYEEDS